MDFQKELIIFRMLSVGVCFMQSSSPVKNIYTTCFINVCELSIKETFKKCNMVSSKILSGITDMEEVCYCVYIYMYM